jgi:hypothetical protein
MYHYGKKDFYEEQRLEEEGLLDLAQKGMNAAANLKNKAKEGLTGGQGIKIINEFLKETKKAFVKGSTELPERKECIAMFAEFGAPRIKTLYKMLFGTEGEKLLKNSSFGAMAAMLMKDEDGKIRDAQTAIGGLAVWLLTNKIVNKKAMSIAFTQLNAEINKNAKVFAKDMDSLLSGEAGDQVTQALANR